MLKHRLIDVSVWMDSYRFPGNPACQPTGPFNRVSGQNREYVYDFELCTQTGTHIQGPHYFLPDGKRINEFPLEMFEGDAYVAIIEKRGIDTTKTDLENKLDKVNLDGKILILRTDHMNEVIESGILDPLKRPGLSLEAAKYLVEIKKIRMIAIDSVGLESRITEHYEVNRYLCEQRILILEGLVNLHEVSQLWVYLEAFPLKIKNVEGTPCRAIIKEEI